jgi:Nucleotidyl transferase AbiEii toxin, Type IV TA system
MKHANSRDFRAAVEQRLKNTATGQPTANLNRMRRRIVFERWLARIQITAASQWILKGGVALDFRLGNRARFTRDLDLAIDASEAAIAEHIVEASETELDDYFSYLIEDQNSIVIDGDTRALRFRIRAELDGRRFDIVSIDVGLGTYLASAPDAVYGSNFLEFAGIKPAQYPTIPLSQHLAEKLHAYARIYFRGRPSSRVKDLVDMALIVTEHPFSGDEVIRAIRATFAAREQTPVPGKLHLPPGSWAPADR